MPNKLYQKIKFKIPKKVRRRIFRGSLKAKQRISNLLVPTILYLIDLTKVFSFSVFVHPSKEISVIYRIKNEEEYLYNSVTAIIDYVDEVILVDNQSSDKSPEIIKKLKNIYPQKIKFFRYPHPIAKVGLESRNLALENKKSPSHIVNFTNWCLEKCTKPYILPWAPDHLATPELEQSIKNFKKSPHQLFFSRGLNIYPDLEHSVKTIKNRVGLEENFFGGAFDTYLTEYTFNECRIFPKKFSRYSFDFPYLESFTSPFLSFPKYIYFDKKISFLHLKFCKKNPYQILSDDIKNVIIQKLEPGEKLKKKYLSLISNLNIQSSNEPLKSSSKPNTFKRSLIITIDGDGFCWKNSKSQLAGQIFYEEIIKKYPFLFTASVIVKDLLERDKTSIDLTKKIFASKSVEIASHSFSHPRNWQDPDINLKKEIDYSVEYINNFLSPKNKKVKIFLWTGQCNPDKKALSRVENLRIFNFNGNEINSPYIQKGHFKQYMSRAYPDWHYMNLKKIWRGDDSCSKLITYKGKLDGYKEIIKYFEDNPSRPVHLWLHWYSALRKDSLEAIKEALNWCLNNDLKSVYASEYIKNIEKMF